MIAAFTGMVSTDGDFGRVLGSIVRGSEFWWSLCVLDQVVGGLDQVVGFLDQLVGVLEKIDLALGQVISALDQCSRCLGLRR